MVEVVEKPSWVFPFFIPVFHEKYSIHIISLQRFEKDFGSPIYAFFQPIPSIGSHNGRDSMKFTCAQRAAKRKFGATWTRMMPTRLAIYEDMQTIWGSENHCSCRQTKTRSGLVLQ